MYLHFLVFICAPCFWLNNTVLLLCLCFWPQLEVNHIISSSTFLINIQEACSLLVLLLLSNIPWPFCLFLDPCYKNCLYLNYLTTLRYLQFLHHIHVLILWHQTTEVGTGSAVLLFENQNVLHANRPRLLPSDSEVFSSPKNPLVSTNYIVLISLFLRLRVFCIPQSWVFLINGVSLITYPCIFEVCCTMIILLVFSIPVQTVHFLVFSFLSLIGLFGLLI